MSTPADRRRMAVLAAGLPATSSRLPERSGDPRESFFGSGKPPTPAQPSVEALAMAQEDKLVFLEYITCHLCNYPFYSDATEQRKFWMTSCGHVLCSNPAHSHVTGTCTKCNRTGIETYCLEQGLHESLQPWFFSTDTYLRAVDEAWPKLKFQIRQLYRHNEYLKGVSEKRKALLEEMRQGIETLSQYERLYKDVEEANATLQRENTDLKRQLALSTMAGPPRSASMPPERLQNHYPPTHNMAIGHEEFAEHIVNGHSSMGDRPEGQNKRKRLYETPQRQLDSYGTLRGPVVGSGRLTLRNEPPLFDNGDDDQSTSSRSTGVRTNLDRYRHIPSRPTASTPQPRPMVPQYNHSQRPRSALPEPRIPSMAPPAFAPPAFAPPAFAPPAFAPPQQFVTSASGTPDGAQYTSNSATQGIRAFVPNPHLLPPIQEHDEDVHHRGPPRHAQADPQSG